MSSRQIIAIGGKVLQPHDGIFGLDPISWTLQ